MNEFERARRETVRYHEELYSSAGLGQAGTWLARPHRLPLHAPAAPPPRAAALGQAGTWRARPPSLLLDALAYVPSGRPVIAYDLGAGIGRHTIPMMQQ